MKIFYIYMQMNMMNKYEFDYIFVVKFFSCINRYNFNYKFIIF